MGSKALKMLVLLIMTGALFLGIAVSAYAVSVDCVVLENEKKIFWDLRVIPTMSLMNGSYYGQDIGLDFNCDSGLTNVRQTDQDLAATVGTMLDENEDGQIDLLALEVDNPYPGYYNSVSVKVTNYGSQSIIMPLPVLNWGGMQIPLPDGQVVPLYDSSNNLIAEVSWLNNTGRTLVPGARFEEVFDFHIISMPDPPDRDLNGLTPGYWKNWVNHYTEEQMAVLLSGTIASNIQEAGDIFKKYSNKPGMELSMLRAQLLAAQLTLNLSKHPEFPNPDESFLSTGGTVQWQGAAVTVGSAVNRALTILANPTLYTREQVIAAKDLLDYINNL